MRQIISRAFVLLGFSILACAPLAATTQNADVKATIEDVGKRDKPLGQRHLFGRFTGSKGATGWAGVSPIPAQIRDHFTLPPALTENDLVDNLRLAQDYGRPLFEQMDPTPNKSAKGTCASCNETYPKCVYNATILSSEKTHQLRLKHAVKHCAKREDKCLKKCK